MSEQQPIDLADPRNIPAELRGVAVVLSPDGDGGITIADAHGRPFWVGDLAEVRDELKLSGDIADLSGRRADLTDGLTDDELELYRAWERFRNGDDAPETSTDTEDTASLSGTDAEDDGFTDDGLFAAWQQSYADERGIDLADLAETDETDLKPGDAVEWGSGHGVGHGIVMEVDTSNGNVNVHTCEVVTEGGAGPQLSPTGRTIKIDGVKLRRTSLRLIGEEPVGPERASMSADLSDELDPGVGTDSDDDATFFGKVMRSLQRVGGGFGG